MKEINLFWLITEEIYFSIWNWLQKYKPRRPLSKNKKIAEFIVDETLIMVDSAEFIWSGIVIEVENKEILSVTISKERNMLMSIEEKFISDIAKAYGKHPVSTEMVDHGIHHKIASF